MAPQWVWPQTKISLTFRCLTAYSMVAVSPEACPPGGGTMFPAFLIMNRSPGSVWVRRFGFNLESEQVMKRACGDWPLASLRMRASFSGRTLSRNFMKPSIIRVKGLLHSSRKLCVCPYVHVITSAGYHQKGLESSKSSKKWKNLCKICGICTC